MRKLILMLITLVSVNAMGSHIVGGEFELLHLQGFTYRLNLVIYFDQLNGNPGAKDQNAVIKIFRKSDDFEMLQVNLPLTTENLVDYTQPDCSNGEIVTTRIIYTNVITLSPENFSDPEGYYIVWERCCRNYNITNVISEDPNAGGIGSGQTFYLEFPPVTIDGEPFINSSPKLFPPLNDYACPNKPYYVDFGGVDDDGDSLVYTLVTPLNSSSSTAVPTPSPRPHPVIIWEDGFDVTNVLNGVPDLNISIDGFLTATPTVLGLYVFAVKCEEFRDGIKIGEVRRDFQMLVVDQCPVAVPPDIRGKRITDANFSNADNLTVNFPNTVSDDQRCVQVRVTDADALRADENFQEEVSIRAISLNFRQNISEVLPPETTATLVNGSSEIFEICFPECPYVEDGPFEIGIVAFDDACALPLTDTMKITVNVQPPPNQRPYFANTKGGSRFNTITRRVTESASGNISFPINGFDDDNHDLTMEIIPMDFDLERAGMSFTDPIFAPGSASTNFSWDFDCNAEDLDFNEGRDVSANGLISRAFDVLIIVDDADDCQFATADSLMVNLIIDFPGQTAPEIYPSSATVDDDYLMLEYTVEDFVTLAIRSEDQDNDRIRMEAIGLNFSLEDFDANFPTTEGNGNPGLNSNFTWSLACPRFDLTQQDSFRVAFVVEDFDKCALTNADTLIVDFKILPIENDAPNLSVVSLDNEIAVTNNSTEVFVGQEIHLNLIGTDVNVDSIFLSLLDVQGPNPSSFQFDPKRGLGAVSSPLVWEPGCEDLAGFPESMFTFTFLLEDNACIDNTNDTLQVAVLVKDTDAKKEEFLPPNVFTPNGDDINEYFALEGINEATGDPIQTGLPLDNCAGQFENIRIFDRWGKQIFESRDRSFKWGGDGRPAGVYFYYIEFTDAVYRGSVSIRF
ncbi:MAG: gliding motility-associated C-terminal domain-containing protein [Bacteroidota bacterium]